MNEAARWATFWFALAALNAIALGEEIVRHDNWAACTAGVVLLQFAFAAMYLRRASKP